MAVITSVHTGTIWAAAVVLLLGPAASMAHGQMSGKDAMRLMELDRDIRAAEEKALAGDAAFGEAADAAVAAQEELKAHRARFLADRDGDAEYIKTGAERESALSRLKELEAAQSEHTRARRDAMSSISTAKSAIANGRSKLAAATRNRDRYQKRYDQLLASWKKGDEDDAGTNQSGGRTNSLAAMQEKIDEYQEQITDLEDQIAEASSQIDDAQPIADAATEELKQVLPELSQVKREAEIAEKAHAEVARLWDVRYTSDPKTARLETAMNEAMARQDAARAAALAALRASDERYAEMLAERAKLQAQK